MSKIVGDDMNIIHLKYVVEVAKTKSISKAAENLFMGQPNLSRSIKELEQDLGITIFRRNSKGIELTTDGEEFVQYAKKILFEVEEVEKKYKKSTIKKEKFSIVVPRASYVEESFLHFMNEFNLSHPMDIIYKETNSLKAINKVLQGEYRLGIIRFRSFFEKYFQDMFHEKGLEHRTITEFTYRLIVSKNHPLTKLEHVTYYDLENYIEVCHADPYVPNMPFSSVKRLELSENIHKRISVYERASQFDLLENVANTFMWVSPIPKRILDKYNLVEIEVEENQNIYKDVLIYRSGYRLTDIDKRFIDSLCVVKRDIIDKKKI